MVPYLIATEGANAGSTYLLGVRTLVGRSEDSDIQLLERDVSRRHALILKGPDGIFRIGDLSSTNGTYVSGYRISGCRLAAGETVTVGSSRFLFLRAASLNEIVNGLSLDDLKLVSGPVEYGTEEVPVQLSGLVDGPSQAENNAGNKHDTDATTLRVNEEVAWWHDGHGADPADILEAGGAVEHTGSNRPPAS